MKISACVITKNEDKNIGRWFASIKEVASEIIVVDTGSTDRTVELAEAEGANVYFYQWHNDFAAAKNFAISKAHGDWIFFLDADEYFSEDTIENVLPYIRKIHINRRIDAVMSPRLELNVDEGYRYMGTSQVVRIFRRDIKIFYEGKIHETLIRRDGILRLADPQQNIKICHTGYSATLIRGKLERNLAILQQEIEQMGEQRRHCLYLLDCYYGLKDYAKAIEYAQKCVNIKVAPFGQESMVYRRWIDALVFSNADIEEILTVIAAAIEKYPELPEFYWNKGKLLFDLQDYIGAEEALQMTWELYQRKHFKGASGTFETKLSYFYYLFGEIYRKKDNRDDAAAFFVQALKEDTYNKEALEKLYEMIRIYDPVDVLQILQQIYDPSVEAQVNFLENILKQYPLDKVYLYYTQVLHKNFNRPIPEISTAALCAAEKYQEAVTHVEDELTQSYQSLIISVLRSRDYKKYESIQAILPQMYIHIMEAFSGKKEPGLLTMEEMTTYEEILKQIDGNISTTNHNDSLIEKTIIVIAQGNISLLQQCIAALYEHTKFVEYIIIDNSLNTEISHWLQMQDHIYVIANACKESFSVCANKGIKVAAGENIAILHDYVIVQEGWLEKLCCLMDEKKSVGAVAPSMLNGFQQTAEQKKGNSLLFHRALFVEKGCLILKKSVYEEVGVFDETILTDFLQVGDYSLRMWKSGYEVCTIDQVPLRVSFDEFFSDKEVLTEEQVNCFKKKWGFNLVYSAGIRTNLLQYIVPLKQDLQILDIGCACGGNLMYIKDIYPEVQVYGIELNPYAADIATCFGEICQENIETMEKPEWIEKFEYVILGDILEHLQDPANALKKIYTMLKPGGAIIASIPNVKHISVMENLLAGFWRYEDAGILDRTHLRFFTKIEIQDLIVRNGFVIREIGYTTTELTEKQKELKQYLMAWRGADQDEEEYDAYQWIVYAEKEATEEMSVDPLKKRCVEALRKMENERLEDESELLILLTSENMSAENLFEWIKEAFENWVKTMIDTTVFLYKKGCQTNALQLAEYAYLRNTEDMDLTYAYAFLLHLQGENQKASEIIIDAVDFSEELLELSKEVEGALMNDR